MSLLARFDPDISISGQLLIVLLQTSVAISAAGLWGHTLFRRRPEARHALWLSVLIMALVSPAIAAAVRQARMALWTIDLPVRGITESHALGTQHLSHVEPRFAPSQHVAESPSVNIREAQQALDETAAVNYDEPRAARTLLAGTSNVAQEGNSLVGGLILLWAIGAAVGIARIAVLWKRTGELCHSAAVLGVTKFDQRGPERGPRARRA
jgi:hypothetical protein